MSEYFRVAAYYKMMRRFFDLLSEGTGFYNIGWQSNTGGEFHEAQRMLVEKVAEPLKSQEGWILETGSGQGGAVTIAQEMVRGRVIGLELLTEQVLAAMELTKLTKLFVRGDAVHLPFGNSTFSGVYCIESAFHYSDKEEYIREVARVLQPGGIFSIADVMRKEAGAKYVAKLAARAFGSSGFATKQDYQLNAAESGLELLHCEDLTSGVALSFRSASKRIALSWRKLRREYPIWVLVTFVLTGTALPLCHRFGPVEYRWLVFRKPLSVN